MSSTRLATLLLPLLLTTAAVSNTLQAETAAGIWTSTTGSTIVIPNSPKSFDIVVASRDGSNNLYSGTWKAGAGGRQFSYSSGQVNCVFDARNANRVTVTNRSGSNTWTRTHLMSVRAATGNLHSEAKTVAGVWVASTGATIIIPSNPNKFLLIVKRPAGNNGVYRGVWDSGQGLRRFRYAVGKNLWTCSVRADNPNRIIVQGSGKAFTWDRTHVMTAVSASAPGGGFRPGGIVGGAPQGGHGQGGHGGQANQGGNGQGNQGGHIGHHHPETGRGTSVAGIWVSSSGNKIIIPANPDAFDIIFKRTDGRQFLLKGRWVAGHSGHQFSYTLNNIVTVCTLDAYDSNRIVCTVPGNKYVWTRLHANFNRPAK